MDIIRKISRRHQQEFLRFLFPPVLEVHPLATLGIDASQAANRKSVAPLLEKVVRNALLSYIRGQRAQERPKKVWEEFLPHPEPDIQALVQAAAGAAPWWESLSHTPGFSALVETHLLGSLIRQLGKEHLLAQEMEERNKTWRQHRPDQFTFASKLVEKLIHQVYRGAGENLLRQIHRLYLAGYRQIDEHLVGSGAPITPMAPVQVLEQSKHQLSPAQEHLLRQKKFIPLQPAQPGNYHSDSELDTLSGYLMLDSFRTQGGVNHDHFVFAFVKYTTPLTSLPVHRYRQKGLESPHLTEHAHSMDWSKMHWKHECEPVLSPAPPEGMRSILPGEWFLSHRILPCTLSALGIAPYWSTAFQDAVLQVRRQCPEFTQAVASYTFNPELVLWHLFQPLVAKQVLEELQHLISDMTGEKKTTNEQVEWVGKHQQDALAWAKERFKISDRPTVRRTVQSAPSTNWCGHGDWYLLPEHIREMEKDGMSRRSIKMSGVYSVTENALKEDVLSRQGRSKVRHRVEELGNLLVYPNPLIGYERHSKTEFGEPKYLAPEESISPPMLIPAQADFTRHNHSYLTSINSPEFVRARQQALSDLRHYEQKVDLSNYTQHLLQLGHATDQVAKLATLVLARSAANDLYAALDDPAADIELTEGQKKTYVMYQSYKELIEREDFEFLSSLPVGLPFADYPKLLEGMPRRPNKLFVCSPGVWQPLKSWKKFPAEDKKFILGQFSAIDQPTDTVNSPLNPRNKYCLTPSWAGIINYQNRRVIITYDQDADQNPGVALSVSALAQCFLDIAPHSRISYRRITIQGGISAKGADDYIVAHGGKAFWDLLDVSAVAANISHGELVSQPQASYIGYLIAKAQELDKATPRR